MGEIQAQGQATQGRELSTLAPLRALPARMPDTAGSRPVVREGVKSCPRSGCGEICMSGSMSGVRKRSQGRTSEAPPDERVATNMFGLPPPHHTLTLPNLTVRLRAI